MANDPITRSGSNYSTPRDSNRVPLLAAASTADGITPVTLEADPSTHLLQVSSTGGSGGTQYTDGAAAPTHPIGTATEFVNGSGNWTTVSSANPLPITGTISVGSTTDSSTFTAGTSTTGPIAGAFNDGLSALTSGQQGTFRSTAYRAQHINLRNNSGTEIGTASTPIQVSLANTATNSTAVKVDGSGVTQPVSLTSTTITGTVAATQSGTWNIGTVTAVTAITNALPAGTNAIGAITSIQNALPNGTNSLGTVGLNAGTAVIGKVGIDQSTPGTTNGVQINAALPAGTNTIGSINNISGTISLPTGAATSANQTSGGQKSQIVDGSNNTIPSSTATTQNSTTLGLNVAPIGTGQDFYPGYNNGAAGGGQIATDAGDNLVTRGAVLTDEGTFRINFTNSSLYTTSAFNATFTNNSQIVTFASSINGILKFGSFIALSSDGGSATTLVLKIINSTTVYLASPYLGSSSTGTFIYGTVSESVGSGGGISVASGQATITAGTTATSQTYMYGPAGISVSYYVEASFSLSQRIANQDIYFGFEASPFATITQFGRFHFTGTTNTQVITETGFNPTGAPSSSEQETNTVTLPGGVNTSALQTYRMVVELDKIYFYVNGNLIATHTRRLPRQQDFLYQGATYGLRVLNGTTPASGTSIVVDYIFLRTYDRLDANLVTSATANASNNSTTGTLLGAGMIGQYNSTLPTVTSGNYYTAQLDSSGRQLVSAATTPAVVNVGQQTVSTSAVQISSTSTVPTNGIIVQALSTNSASIFVGGSGVTTTNGFEIQKGQAVSFTCNLNTLYIISAASTTDKVCYNVE